MHSTLYTQLIGYADPAANHNLGDQLLWAGSNKLFQRFGKRAAIHCGVSQSKNLVSSCLDKKDDLIKVLGDKKGLIYFNPGGNWGDMYRHVQKARFDVWKFAHENGIKFISGPQSIFYSGKGKSAARDTEFISQMSGKDLLTFRQHDSFEYAQRNYGNFTVVKESPDMAFMLGPQVEHDKTKVDVFMLVRQDDESKMADHYDNYDKICKAVISKGYTCAIGDWKDTQMDRVKDFDKHAEEESDHAYYSDIGVQLAISTISIGELIVTDRLHGAILGFLMGKTVIYIDNAYRKLSSVFNTAFANKASCADTKTFGLFEAVNIAPHELAKSIIHLLAKKRVH